jgi:hypothetical protein
MRETARPSAQWRPRRFGRASGTIVDLTWFQALLGDKQLDGSIHIFVVKSGCVGVCETISFKDGRFAPRPAQEFGQLLVSYQELLPVSCRLLSLAGRTLLHGSVCCQEPCFDFVFTHLYRILTEGRYWPCPIGD